MAVSTASIARSRTPTTSQAFLYHSTQQPCKHVSRYSTKSSLVTSQCCPSSTESHFSSSIFPMTGSFYHSRHTSITCSNHRSHLRNYSTFLRPLNVKFPLIPPDYWSTAPLNFSRCISRAINIALKRRTKKITIPRTLQLIDEQGSNLGVMTADIALKLAESKNLKIVDVRKATSDSVAVYRLFTSKQQWEDAKKKKKSTKSDPRNVTKDITIFSRIGEHDLAVKISHLREFLEKGHSARVFVQTKFRRGMNEEEERDCRTQLVKTLVAVLEGLGEKVSETKHQRRGLVCLFRPTK